MANEPYEPIRKDPAATLDYGFDWTEWLATDEIIDESTWDVPTGLTKGDTESGEKVTLVWLSGGTAGRSYQCTNRISTNQDRTDERTLTIKVVER